MSVDAGGPGPSGDGRPADDPPVDPAARRAALAAALGRLDERVVAACGLAGRPREAVRVVVTTKTWPASDVRHLAALGVRDVGEARAQEGGAKREEVLAAGGDGVADLRWHVLGRLQRNKAGAVAAWASLVHSCDSERLAAALDRGAQAAGRVLPVLVQVDLDGDGDEARGGVPVAGAGAVVDAVAGAEGLRLDGVMAVAPLGADPAAAFARLADVAARVRADHPAAVVVSAGMSDDLEQAVAAGATLLRVGRAVLGARPPLG